MPVAMEDTIRAALPKIQGEAARAQLAQKPYLGLMWSAVTAHRINACGYSRAQFAMQALFKNAVFAVAKTIFSLGLFVIGASFWKNKKASLISRTGGWIRDLARAVISPFMFPLNEIASLIGIINPKKANDLSARLQAIDKVYTPNELISIVKHSIYSPKEDTSECERAIKHLKDTGDLAIIKAAYAKGIKDAGKLAQRVKINL